jgi:hypothetical protein
MDRKQVLRLARGISLLVAGIVITAEFSRQHLSTPLTTTAKESTRRLSATTLADEIAKLEVEKLLESVKFAQSSPKLVTLQEQQVHLEQQLVQLNPQNNQKLVELATTRAIESQIADLDLQYAKNRVKFQDHHPMLEVQASQLSALRQRLSTLQ